MSFHERKRQINQPNLQIKVVKQQQKQTTKHNNIH